MSRVVDGVRWIALLDLAQERDHTIVKAPQDVDLPHAIAAYQSGKAPVGVIGAALSITILTNL